MRFGFAPISQGLGFSVLGNPVYLNPVIFGPRVWAEGPVDVRGCLVPFRGPIATDLDACGLLLSHYRQWFGLFAACALQ